MQASTHVHVHSGRWHIQLHMYICTCTPTYPILHVYQKRVMWTCTRTYPTLSPALDVGGREVDLSVEATGPHQSGVQHVWPVGTGQNDHVRSRVEAL